MVIQIIWTQDWRSYTKVPKAKSLKIMIIMWNVFLNSQDTMLLAIQPAIQPATSISTKVIDDDWKWFLIKFGTLIKISLFYPSFCFNWIHRHKHEIALSAHKHPFFCRGKTVTTAARRNSNSFLPGHQHLYFTFISWLLNSRWCTIVGEVTINAKIFVVVGSFLLG